MELAAAGAGGGNQAASAAAVSCGSFGPDLDTRTRHSATNTTQHIETWTQSLLYKEHWNINLFIG